MRFGDPVEPLHTVFSAESDNEILFSNKEFIVEHEEF